MEQKISDIIKQAEMILVGIGEEFTPDFPPALTEQGKEMEPYLKSRYYQEIPDDHPVIRAYNRLRTLLGAKPYFVITMNTDDLIFRSAIEPDLVVAPCGSLHKMQCGEHILEAEAVRNAVLESGDVSKAVCPRCGRPLQFHTVDIPGYMEEGYLKQWEKYTRWLSCTLNRKLCILELGVGFAHPQVVRWPFEKVAACNLKSDLIRVHSKFPQIGEGVSSRGVSVKASPVSFLLEEQRL